MTTRAGQFEPLPPEVAARWSGFGRWETTFFPSLVGIQLEEVRRDYARMRLPYRAELLQPAGVVHGGALATLVDTVVVPAIGSAYDEARAFFTIDMQVRYLAAVRAGEDAIAEGWVVRRGSSILFCDAEVRSSSGAPAVTATLVYKVARGTVPAPGAAGGSPGAFPD